MEGLIYIGPSQLAEIIHERGTSSVDVLEAHLQRIAQHNPELNAIVTLDEEDARLSAREADEALACGENWNSLDGVGRIIPQANTWRWQEGTSS